MLHFFRTIRRRLLDSGKIKNYTLYAIGEILLVVIGILIALQVNNWNEQRKIKDKEQKYLLAIKNELINNLDAISKEQARLKNALEAQGNLIALIEAESDTVSEQYLSTLILQSFSDEIILAYERGVFTQLLSTGGLNDISNDSIKIQIASWDGRVNDLRKQEEELYLYRNTITQYFIDHADIKTMFTDPTLSAVSKDGKSKKNHSNKHLLKDQTFENFLLLYSVIGQILHDKYYPELEANINSLLQLVEGDLNIKN
ncbi:MAG: hypothetical protein IPJ74_23895 [Saprospiraceae bacterium]|nr:hypothetical protein [Saprospiraceae bacterium]